MTHSVSHMSPNAILSYGEFNVENVFVLNGSLKYHFTCNSFFKIIGVVANFKRE